MDTCEKNRQMVIGIGDIVEALYNEVEGLPLTDGAKSAIVTMMLGDLLQRNGNIVTLRTPPNSMEFTPVAVG